MPYARVLTSTVAGPATAIGIVRSAVDCRARRLSVIVPGAAKRLAFASRKRRCAARKFTWQSRNGGRTRDRTLDLSRVNHNL